MVATPDNVSGDVPGPAAPIPTAIVVAGDEETRVLLRGLLRLHHFRVLGEAEGETHGLELVGSQPPTLVVVDVNLAEGSPAGLISGIRAVRPTSRVVLVSPSHRPPTLEGASRPDATLPRPFRIHQFAEAVSPPTAAAAAP